MKQIRKTAYGASLLLLFLFLLSGKAFAIGPGDERLGSTGRPLTEDSTAGLCGGRICFLNNEASSTQQLSAVIQSSDGKVIVVDGGTKEDAPHLLRVIKECGGAVDAWLITHAHSDHVGGLYAILKDHPGEIDIRLICYCFPEHEWYEKVEPGRLQMVDLLTAQLAAFPQERQLKTLSGGEVIPLSEHLSVKVLNAPRKSYDAFAVNSSSVMYDITVEGKHVVILGDMGEQVGNELLREGVMHGIVCDYLQLSHHGQRGVSQEFYRECAPKNCIWCCPVWLYEAKQNNKEWYLTWRTKEWIEALGVQKNFCTAYGDVVIR